MTQSQYACPLIINSDGKSSSLQKIPISAGQSRYDESFIQKLAYDHPECLPVNEIDRAFEGLIPVCMELNTEAGPLDILYVTPKGRLAVVEAKLWRNPEARRKVVGQILDYAKELSHWDYEYLQREVSRATNRKGNVLYELVVKHYPETIEAEFVDAVTRNLKTGGFMLMILGDGIREGVGAIAQFLEEVGSLEFVFGLVELALYQCPDGALLVQPRVLAKTTIFNRVVVEVNNGRVVDHGGDQPLEEEQELQPYEKYYLSFWPEMMSELKLDDPSQPSPKSLGKAGNIFFPLPPRGQAWLTCYFSQADKGCGVFLTFIRGALADELYKGLLTERAAIDKELGIEVSWESDGSKHKIACRKKVGDIFAESNRAIIKMFMTDTINRFVNVFRHRLQRMSQRE